MASCAVTALEAPHVAAAAATLSQAFSYESEYSWSRPLGLPQDRFAFWLEHIHLPERAAGEPKSLVADGGSAGVLVLEDLNAKAEESEEAEAPAGMAAIEAILAECKEVLWAELRSAADRDTQGVFAYHAFLGVAEQARRRGVGAALVQRANAELKARRFRFGVAFCTSRVSAALYTAQGFKRVGGVHYHRFAMPSGERPFASLPDDECAVMLLDMRAPERV